MPQDMDAEMTLLEKIEDAIDIAARQITEYRDALIADPSLAENLRWRDNLEMYGYMVYTQLSTEDD